MINFVELASFMDEGKMLFEAPPAEFFANPDNERLQSFLSKVL